MTSSGRPPSRALTLICDTCKCLFVEGSRRAGDTCEHIVSFDEAGEPVRCAGLVTRRLDA